MTWEELAKFIMEMPEEERCKEALRIKDSEVYEIDKRNFRKTNVNDYFSYLSVEENAALGLFEGDWVIE